MLETKAMVISVDGDQAIVESIEGGGCGKCENEKGCGSSKLAQLFGNKPRRFRVRNDVNASVGTEVQVVTEEGVLLRSALLMYVLPLVFMFAGAILAGLWVAEEDGDIYSALGAVTGLIISFMFVKWLSRRKRLLSVTQQLVLPASKVYP